MRAKIVFVAVMTIVSLCSFMIVPQAKVQEQETTTQQETTTEQPTTTDIEVEIETVSEPVYKLCGIPLEQDLQVWLFGYCEKKGISPYLVMAMCERESQYNSREVGDNGESFGMMQIQPKWHQQRMGRLGCYNLLDPQENIIIGIDILLYLFDKSDDVAWVLMAYNGGEDYANINYN